MIESREKWLELLWSLEGGFIDHPSDPGGATNHGVTQATLEQWRKRPVTVDEVKQLTREEAGKVALSLYWNPCRGDMLPGGLDVYLVDMVWHAGAGNAVPILQRIVGVEQDGFVGDLTVSACRQCNDTAKLIDDLHQARLAYLRSKPHWSKFGEGWTNRCSRVRNLAYTLLQSNFVEAGIPKSRIVWGSLGGFSASLVAIFTSAPEIVTAGQRAHQAVSTGDIVQVTIGLAGAIGTLAAIYARVSDYYRARHMGAGVAAK